MYEIKRIPEDFVVKELALIRPSRDSSGRYAYFIMKKRMLTTPDAAFAVAQRLGLPEKSVGYAGNKDKHAVTEQVISVNRISYKKAVCSGIKTDKLETRFIGMGDEPVSLGMLKGNSFEIIARNLDEWLIKKADQNIRQLEKNKWQLPNYFDDQRFGRCNAAIGEAIIRQDFRRAITLMDSSYKPLLSHISEHSNDAIGAMRRIPRRVLRIYVNAYQSLLFNAILGGYIEEKAVKDAIARVSYSEGFLLFPRQRIRNALLPLPGFATETKGVVRQITEAVLSESHITPREFILRSIPELSLQGTERQAFFRASCFRASFTEDMLNPGKKALPLCFLLPKGSYATILIKRLFC
ncbi:hypothetical protein COT48_00210 [Candidatus Woesearchaeota archaeon CG08_land_8_20_14_0_20_47_9]|nr:MAG: hypothetical protein AUJ69_03025 [Candidatus Woesearchaeota archaeon CG1_02_47_18]PIN72938.1 MAG: hypothetical protein COV22_01880 [Candidatus Woesearchaeota archaeon CG10_big_fil_rev_8_21_14_0_10_47_5]PIO04489.1 MAG: hypothetical protein COT48_00210 [Candidatus Woesearchaeota archaeon CG08_land_8_20_14_0_20_47_9]HII30264.1 tRNA pseudouridine(13) synthase TruD [Candidatus Woesearchaeota archaeon]